MDYQTHMFKFAPLLAYSYAMAFGAHYLLKVHKELLEELKNGDFSKLDILHHLSAGFKAVYTKITYEGIDTVRQACGGAGFSAYSGLPSLQIEYAPNTTFEGDNTVMLQQTAKYLMKTWKNIHRGFKATGLFSYFNEFEALLKSKANIKSADDFLCLKQLETALSARTAFKIKTTMDKLAASKSSDNEKVNSFYAVEITQMAHSHILLVTFKIFQEYIESDKIKCPKIKENLTNLAKLLGIVELIQDSAPLYETGYFTLGTAPLLLEAAKKLMITLRPQMIPLVESWGLADSTLVSAIGNSYGDIYE